MVLSFGGCPQARSFAFARSNSSLLIAYVHGDWNRSPSQRSKRVRCRNRVPRYAGRHPGSRQRESMRQHDLVQPPRARSRGLAAAALMFGVSACGGSSDSSETNADHWRIGLEAPLSGQLKTLGQGMLNGAELAADQINGDGGLSGKDIEIVPIDDGGDPTVAFRGKEGDRRWSGRCRRPLQLGRRDRDAAALQAGWSRPHPPHLRHRHRRLWLHPAADESRSPP